MVAAYYPFIDIAVHEKVRERYAAGEALALFTVGLDHVLWANGAGASLFGFGSVYDFLEQGPDRRSVFFRQFEATAGGLAVAGANRSFTIRVASGFQSRIINAHVEVIVLPDGASAYLFAAPTALADASPEMRARQMLAGLDDPDTHMAVLDDEGALIAASVGYPALGVTAHTAKALVNLISGDASGLTKRSLPTARGNLPAAAARISAHPALNLIFVIDNSALAPATTPPSAAVPDTPNEALVPVDDVMINDTSTVEDPVIAADVPAFEAESFVEPPAAVASEADINVPAPMPIEPVTADHPVETVATPSGFVFDPSRRPFRFVWKTGADGRFSDVSSEFADAVGPHAADIRGQSFMTLAERYGFDIDNKIAEALARRDTWSGKTVLWPVEGTNLRVPVDLAALPAYNRSREFDGFRGFGIVRPGDAIVDERGIGLHLGDEETVVEDDAALAPLLPDVDTVTTEATQVFAEAAETLAAAPQAQDAHNEASPVVVLDAAAEEEPVTLEPETQAEPSFVALADVAEESTDEPMDMQAVDTPVEEPAESDETPVSAPEETLEWPEGEPPVLKFSANPGRRLSDKIISLEEHRARAFDSLTAGEQAAFREIGRKLEAFRQEGTENENPDAVADPAPEIAAAEDTPSVEPVVVTPETPAQPLPDVAPEPEIAALAAELGEPASAADAPESVDFVPSRKGEQDGLNADILAQMPVALLVLAGDVLYHANPEFLRLTGYDDLDAVRAVGGLDALLQRSDLEDKEASAGSMVLVKADDELLPVTAKLQSVRWEGASALMLALMPASVVAAPEPAPVKVEPSAQALMDGPANDLARLRVEVEEMRSILETATDGVVILGNHGEIRSMNRSASALFNYDEEETRGKPFVMLFAHESQKAVADYLNGLSDNGVMSVLNDGREVIGREASGGLLPLFMTIGKLSSSQRYCAVIRDITQWKRSEEELRTAKRAAETANAHKTDFLARVSHEIRTPLNAIIGFADLIASEHFGPVGHPRYIEYSNDIGRSGRHVLDIVNDLLDISKIEAGEMDLDFSAVNLNESITEAVSLVQPQANNQRVIIRTALSHAVPAVVADLRSIKQIVLNILANSIRFTPAGGQIVVSTAYEQNGSVALRIRDTGVGMTRAELEQAMKPFRQVSTNQQKRGEGTGLGLPLTKAMTEANRAAFTIQSAPNEGTLVEISFPPQRVLAN